MVDEDMVAAVIMDVPPHKGNPFTKESRILWSVD
jgi:hypothetical protein